MAAFMPPYSPAPNGTPRFHDVRQLLGKPAFQELECAWDFDIRAGERLGSAARPACLAPASRAALFLPPGIGRNQPGDIQQGGRQMHAAGATR